MARIATTFFLAFLGGICVADNCIGGSLLDVSCIQLNSTSSDGKTVSYLPRDYFEYEVTVFNEEGETTLQIEYSEETSFLFEVDLNGQKLDGLDVTMSDNKGIEIFGVDGPRRTIHNPKKIVLKPKDGFRLFLKLQLNEGAVFSEGLYEIVFSLNHRSISTAAGDKWIGRGGRCGSRFELREPKSDLDRKNKLLILASEATQNGDYAGALERYREYRSFWPNDIEGNTGIGLTLATMGEFADAIPFLEESFRQILVSGDRSIVPLSLAHCYVAVGKEKEAMRVLEHSASPSNAAQQIENIREAIARGSHDEE